MKTIEYNGSIYVNPDRDALIAMGASDADAAGIMRTLAESDALKQRDARLGLAALRIAPLQDAVDLGVATDIEAAQLLAWKGYRVDLNRITAQEGYPGAVVWPEPPALS
jgi:hypothetical protein